MSVLSCRYAMDIPNHYVYLCVDREYLEPWPLQEQAVACVLDFMVRYFEVVAILSLIHI